MREGHGDRSSECVRQSLKLKILHRDLQTKHIDACSWKKAAVEGRKLGNKSPQRWPNDKTTVAKQAAGSEEVVNEHQRDWRKETGKGGRAGDEKRKEKSGSSKQECGSL